MVIGPVRLLAKSGGSRVTLRWKRMIKVLFFAQVRSWWEQMQPKWLRISQLLKRSPAHGCAERSLGAGAGRWQILAAVNQTLVSFDHPLTDGDE